MSPEINLLVLTAASIAFVHTILGPDHYLPFVAMAKARGWTIAKTLRITLWCGLGHLVGSVALGAVGIAFGAGLAKLEWIESVGLAAVVEPELALETIEQDDSQLIQAVIGHDRVIQTLFQQITVLPLRFGTCFQDRESVINHFLQCVHICFQGQQPFVKFSLQIADFSLQIGNFGIYKAVGELSTTA